MKEELIEYDTAVLAKEKGFDNTDIYTSFFYHCPTKKATLNGDMLLKEEDNYIAAPTQSLLQRWLREEHNLWVVVEFGSEFIIISSIINYQTEDINYVGDSYSTYELALEAGLKEALELIT